MKYKLEINQRLPSLNEYIKECNRHYRAGARFKSEIEEMIGWEIKRCLGNLKICNPVKIHFTWIEHNKKRDRDNIVSAKKFIQDALVKNKVLKNDTQKWIVDIQDTIEYAKESKVIVELEEV